MKKNIDNYISSFPSEVQLLLQQLREAIIESAPAAVEVISYSMPAYKLNGMLVYFAGYKNHIGFYPGSSGVKAFEHLLSGYRYSKGTVQFSLDKPLPVDLIKEMVIFRVNENLGKASQKKNKQ